MPRPLRILYPGAWYHVMNRGLGFKNIYDNDKPREMFLGLLSETYEQFELEIHGYCLMDNHYHLLVHTPLGNLSRAMRHINGLYTQSYNRSNNLDGPLFRGRYKAILIEGDDYLLQVSRYIHLNPLVARKINELEGYRWSSYKYYISLEACPTWLKTEKILSMISAQHQVDEYRKFVIDGIDEETVFFYGKVKIPVYVGGEKTKRKRLKDLTAKQIQASITDYRQLEALPTLREVIEYCSQYFECDIDEFHHIKRGRDNTVRYLVMYVCRKWTHATLGEIAEMFGGLTINGVSNAINRIKDKINKNKEVKKLFLELNQKIKIKVEDDK